MSCVCQVARPSEPTGPSASQQDVETPFDPKPMCFFFWGGESLIFVTSLSSL